MTNTELHPFRARARVSPTITAMAALARSEMAPGTPTAVAEVDAERLADLAEVPMPSLGMATGFTAAAWVAMLVVAIMGSIAGALALAIAAFAWTVWALHEYNTDARRSERAVNELVEWPNRLPFRLAGWRDLLLAERPQLRVELEAPMDMRDLEVALREVDPILILRPSSPTVMHVELQRDRVLNARGVIERVLLPLHDELGIARVDAGTAPEVVS